jgi:hypothetical protein
MKAAQVFEGQRYRLDTRLQAICMVQFSAPFTGGGNVVVEAGEIIEVLSDPVPGATAVGCKPVRYEELEKELVPATDLSDDLYAGYYLVVDLDLLLAAASLVAASS